MALFKHDKRSPREQAEMLLDEAAELTGSRRTKLLQRAVKIDPDCVDAYNMLFAEERDTDKGMAWARLAVEAAARRVGAEFLADSRNVGHYADTPDASTYVQASMLLSIRLWQQHQHDEALRTIAELIALEPDPELGIHDFYIAWLLALGRTDDAGRVLEGFAGDDTAWLQYHRALHAFQRFGATPEADALLRQAVQANRLVPVYLLGQWKVPDNPPLSPEAGNEDEAVMIVAVAANAWDNTPDALDWFQEKFGNILREFEAELRAAGELDDEDMDEFSSESKSPDAVLDMLREVVQRQIRERTPPEVPKTYKRLIKLGFTEVQAEKMMTLVLADVMRTIMTGDGQIDHTAYAKGLRRLPTLPEAMGELAYRTPAETREQYLRYRERIITVAGELLNTVIKGDIIDSARALGLMAGNTVVLNDEQEGNVASDHAIYADTQKLDRYLHTYAAAHPHMDEETKELLAAMGESYFTLFVIEERLPDTGARVHDLIYDEDLILVDVGLSQTAQPDVILAAHLIHPGGIPMTTGAPIQVIGEQTGESISALLDECFFDPDITYEEANPGGSLTTRIMRELLGTANHTPAAIGRKPAPNAPCPCGSGEKYKRCCGSK